MPRFIFFFTLILVLIAGCAAPSLPGAQPTPLVPDQPTPAGVDTPAPVPTSPPASPTVRVAQPTVTAEPPTEVPERPPGWIAYIGVDENLWLVNPDTGEQRQLTQDAIPLESDAQKETIRYCCAQWSSDGRLLAYRREAGSRESDGFQYQFDLWVFDLVSGDARAVLENLQVAGYAWRPGTHLIAYGLPIALEYFISRGEPAAELAEGIWAVDADAGSPYELVPPERGFSIISPKWSRDGRFLAFEEMLYMEGRGKFAYYDFEAQQYVAWDDVIGSYDWSPDGEAIAYDRMVYTPIGTERIWLNNRQGDAEQAFSPENEQGYAFNPVFSPQGDRLAYLAELSGVPDTLQYTLFVQPYQNGEPRELGVFEQTYDPAWSPDGERLALSSGPFEDRQVFVVDVAGGSVEVLAEGTQPAWQPVSP